MTRHRAKENEILRRSDDKKSIDESINEEPSITFNDKKYDKIFFMIDSTKTYCSKNWS